MLARAKKKGFTLLELIVVLLVIGILAAIAVPTYDAVKDNSAKRTLRSTAESIADAANAMARSELTGTLQDTTIKDVMDAAVEADVDASPWTWTDADPAVTTRVIDVDAAGTLTFDQGSRCFSVDIDIVDGASGSDDIAVVDSTFGTTGC